MSEVDTHDRIRAAVAGLVEADGITWTAWWHRMSQLPPRRAVRLGQAWDHAREQLSTSLPTPYLQSSSPALVDPAGPTDDTEWFVVGLRSHLGQALDGGTAGAVWTELAEIRAEDPDAVRGRLGTQIALANLTEGVAAPASGNDNPHYFDDHAMVRAVGAGLLQPGRSERAAELAERDASVTHALDGVWGARATAALFAALVGGADRATAIRAARAELPEGSWISHVVAECLESGRHASEAGMRLAASLERGVVDHVYAYATQAPEVLGLLLVHLQQAASADEVLVGALCHPRHADALVPLAAAAAGAHFAEPTQLPSVALGGVCIRALEGVQVGSIVETLTREAAGAVA
jgi:hypothetical protein